MNAFAPAAMRLLVVDNHPVAVEVLSVIARATFPGATVSTAMGFEEAVASARAAERLDLVLLDLGLPGCTGIEALTQFHEAFPLLPVVIVSATEDRSAVLAALDAGAAGYLPKTSTPEVISAALRLIAAGSTYVPLQAVDCSGAGEEDGASRPHLTARQRDVLRLMVQGLANKEIARHLRIAQDTVKQHARAVYAALGVAGRSQAARAVQRRGIKLG